MLYSTTCAFCHGEDARGGDGGPNLLRTEVVLNDDKGELIGNILRDGLNAMPKFAFTSAQIADIAAFIHSFRVAGYDASRQRPVTIVVGDAKAGQAYFQSKCAGCHEVMGDLKNIGSRFPDARTLQQWWLVPGGGGRGAANARLTPATVTVTLPSGQQVSGRIVWSHLYPAAAGGTMSGILTTAGKLLFASDNAGNLIAFDPANGNILWHSRIGQVSNAPETYMIDGHQYILTAAGDMLFAFRLY
jgi:mono/diheme cytochrome c family protein